MKHRALTESHSLHLRYTLSKSTCHDLKFSKSRTMSLIDSFHRNTKANPTGSPTYVTTTTASSPGQEQPSYIVHQQSQQAPVQYVQVPVFHPGPQNMGIPTMHLGNLQSAAATVECPRCKTHSWTRIQFRSGNTTHAWAAVFLFVFALPCIPYLMAGLKDVQHSCAHCGTLLATWHKSGRTEVHAYP